MDSNQIRQSFTSFFADRGHTVRASGSLIPADPTLLITNSGMVPFKPYFLGDEKAPWPRATSVQKCVRTVDIDIIGSTQRHLSFFEMMGNFSFGDYFKEDAIRWGYEFSTEVLGLDAERLWYTVHETDEEAAQIWIDGVGVPPDRVQRGGHDNFWQMGVPGPCGPSSEIFWDRGPEFGDSGGPLEGGEDRYVEFWNLVFMQNIQDKPYQVIGDLPAKSIDTGLGLDRIAAILQDVKSVFDIDTTHHVRDAASAYTGLTYGESEDTDVSLRILSDHGRSVTFLIGDGVVPSNEGRGYILRRLLRRAVRHAWLHGGEGLVMPRLVDATIEVMKGGYPELETKHDFIHEVVTREEEGFRRTLESGHRLLDGELAGEDTVSLSGETAFKLHDTFGFPIELTREIASERGIDVDIEGFEREMSAQRERARAAWKGVDLVAAENFYRVVLDETGLTEFVGYDHDRATGLVLSMTSEGEAVERADEGRRIEIFLDRTPFYGESGGQVGDTGVIETETGTAVVEDTHHAVQGLLGHLVRVTSGTISVGQTATAAIDSPRRDSIRRSHTGTHVLHWALRDVLGKHATQAGSLVEDGRLRFDFSHFSKVAPEELAEIEAEVNTRLIDNRPVTTSVTSKEEATDMGAMAFFGDKYGEVVRVVRVGDFSIELCGGTHTASAGEVGPLVIVSESSIGSNLRRVEALTGMAAYDHLVHVRSALDDTGRLLRVPAAEVLGRVGTLLEKVAGLEEQLESVRTQGIGDVAVELAGRAANVGERAYVVESVDNLNGNELRRLALGVRDGIDGPAVVVLGSVHSGKGALVGVVTPDLVEVGLSAADLIRPGAEVLGGGGSRDPELAQAGGPKGGNLVEALDLVRDSVEKALATA